VATANSIGNAGGKIWKIAPVAAPGTATAKLLVDLSTATLSGLQGSGAVGIALPVRLQQSIVSGIENRLHYNFGAYTQDIVIPSTAQYISPTPVRLESTEIPVLATDFASTRLVNTIYSVPVGQREPAVDL